MSSQFDDLQKRARALTQKEKAALARMLIEDLDAVNDHEVEQLWLEEAQRRYDQYLRGEIEAVPVEEVMARARKRLK